MFETFKSFARSVSAAGTGLALASVAALPMQVIAHDDHPATAVSAVEQSPVDASNRQMVVRDAATGQLRAVTAAEAQALMPKTGAQRTGAQLKTLPRSHASGATGARLTDEFMSYSVVVRQPDGSLATLCFESREEADAALKATSVVKTNTARTE